jgi:FemAB-related protein (PEP-CTERM system-associated)
MTALRAIDSPRVEAAVRVREDVPDDVWDGYVGQCREASAYHYAGWCRLISRAFGHRARMLAAETRGQVSGVLPLVVMRNRLFGRFVISLPFLNAGGVLADDERSARALLDAAVAVLRETHGQYLELRHMRRHFPHVPERHHKVAMTLALQPTVDRQWEVLDRKIRNQVRKAEKSGLTLVSGGAELVTPFYDVFARNMRDLGTPVFGRALFVEVVRVYPENSRVFCVYKDDRPVAASVAHWRDESIEIIWASALREFNPLCANVLLYWQMMQFGISRGCRVFEFGRCTPGEGTFQFKRQWGAEPRPLVWEYCTDGSTAGFDLSPANPKYGRAISVWRRLPLRVTTILGPQIVRNIPC